MLLFSRNKLVGVQTFLLRLVNNHCPEVAPLFDNRRDETRVPICVVTLVVPLEGGKPRLDEHFATVTKEVSTTGVSLVLDGPRGLDELLLGFRWEQDMTFLRGKAKHLNPLGAGFYQLGVQLSQVVQIDEFPALESLRI